MAERADLIGIEKIEANGIDINVATAGAGPALLLLHGFPHTWEVWSRVIPLFSETHRVIAPDPDRVQRLVVMEGILGNLPRPGAAAMSPWWFGFHAIPGFAEHVVEGHEEEYIGFFLDHGLVGDGLTPELRTRFIDSYRGSNSLRCAFEFYRAFGVDAEQINRALEQCRLTVPTLAVGSKPIGSALHGQLQPVADDLTGEVIDNCDHVIPLDRPEQLAAIVHRFLRRS